MNGMMGIVLLWMECTSEQANQSHPRSLQRSIIRAMVLQAGYICGLAWSPVHHRHHHQQSFELSCHYRQRALQSEGERREKREGNR